MHTLLLIRPVLPSMIGGMRLVITPEAFVHHRFSGFLTRKRRELFNSCNQLFANHNQFLDSMHVFNQVTIVQSNVPPVMAVGQETPLTCW